MADAPEGRIPSFSSKQEAGQPPAAPGGPFAPDRAPEPGADVSQHAEPRCGDGLTAGQVPRIPDHDMLRVIGRGSYGEVWLARNATGAHRAVKVVYRATFEHERPFEREFNGIQNFEPISRTHDSQIDILHVGRSGGYFYYVMELADDAGGCLASSAETPASPGGAVPERPASGYERYVPHTLKRELHRRGRLPVPECVEIGLALTTALNHLHRHGLVHRDIKPSNIIFVGGVPKLADIGLVTGVDASFSIAGTEGYISPNGAGTPQADLYSLGKVLYEISSGKDRMDFPEPPTDLGAFADREQLLELDEIIQRACENDLRHRYQSAEEMHADLLLLKTGRSVRRTHLLERRLAIVSRIGIGAVVLTLLAGGAFLYQKKLTLRVERAEKKARESLREAYLAQAHANRWSGQAGRRFESLDALAKATDLTLALKLPPEKLVEIRNEAIACMILPDLRVGNPWPTQRQDGLFVSCDAKFERYALALTNGTVSVRRLRDQTEMRNCNIRQSFRASSGIPKAKSWPLRAWTRTFIFGTPFARSRWRC